MSKINAKRQAEDKEFIKAKDYACRLLSYRQRSIKEMTQRLKRRYFSSETIKKTIEYLIELNYLNDEDFARFWIQTKMQSNPCGWSVLRYQLRQKGIAGQIIDRLINDFAGQYDEYKTAKELAISRRRRYKGLKSAKIKRRLYAYLSRRGFSQEAILQAIE